MAKLIRSGSHTAGVSAESFGLPPGTALRYERPAAELATLLSSYAVLDSDPAVFRGEHSWMLPGWAQIWIVLTEQPISVRVGNKRYDPLASTILYGVTSKAMPVVAHGGVTIAIDLSPLGWARFVKPSAEELRDRITPLGEVLATDQVRALASALHASNRDLAVKEIIDDSFLRHLPPPHPAEPLIARIMALLVDDTLEDLPSAARAIGISPPTLLRLSKRYFGFTPKLLMMRVRFLRALAAMLIATDGVDFAAVPAGYHDVPHLLRDANRFLGMTPRRFLAMDLPYLRAALRARQSVMGASTPSLE